MTRENRKTRKITRGMSSAVMLSILIHVGLFLLAGMLVVFTVVRQKEIEFEPPKAVERPKMKLKKPKVKVKKTSKPKPTTRIVTKVQKASMPDIQLPEMSGMAEGLTGGIDGFDIMPDLGETTLFGSGQSIGNDFVGTFYDIKRDRSGKPLWSTDLQGWGWRDTMYKFFLRDWDFGVLSRYYRSPVKLYTTSFVVPATLSSLAPLAFGDEDAAGGLWVLYYKGQLVCPASNTNGITFRFWGVSDEFMAIKVDGKVVLAMDWRRGTLSGAVMPSTMWNSDSVESRKYYRVGTAAEVGDWITLNPGESRTMELITGGNGGVDHHVLMVEEKGVKYEPCRVRAGPLLPAFKTAIFSRDKLDLIYRELPAGEVCLTNGPVFCDYDTSAKMLSTVESKEPEPVAPEEPESKMRTWSLTNGITFDAEFINQFGRKAVLTGANGKTRKIPLELFSTEDIEYIELARPPSIDINFLNSLKTVSFHGGFYDFWQRFPEKWGNFGVQLKQTSTGEYNHELKVEIFVVGQQLEGNKYILLDHQEFTFNPVEEDRFYEFRSTRKVELQNYPDYYGLWVHGDKYVSCLTSVTDERGKRIKVESPKKWLIENLDNLKTLKVGNYFDKSCMRTFPDRPPIIPVDDIRLSD